MTIKNFIVSSFIFLLLLGLPTNAQLHNNLILEDNNIINELPTNDELMIYRRPPKPW